MNNFEALVSLNLIPQVGSARLEKLLKDFAQPLDIFKASRRDLIASVGERLAQDISSFNLKDLEADLALAKKADLKIITLLDQDYPALLKEIPAPPIVLYVLGKITSQDNLAIGIVGSRRASFYGLSSAEKFAAELAIEGITIVSGMARGVDTYAHRGALKAKGRTIAVIGSGFSHIYPEENADLAGQIALSGAVISEFPMRTMPRPQNFPRRNRLISGLSRGILVTEAAKNSGALITADFALEQGREVFALPGRIDSVGSMGTNALLQQGARVVIGCQDILEELGWGELSVRKTELPSNKPAVVFADQESRLYEYIGRQPVSIDDLIHKTTLSSGQVLSIVLGLQFKKLIKVLPGKQFIRS